jgi:murein DD-endopeptidase MepM/ murein hydrolase activator NlpD
LKLNNLFTLLLLIYGHVVSGQQFLFPVKPGQKNLLAGNFSEIRPNHFHAGIDVKIGGVDGEPIKAIQDGYVSRMKISSFGYGNVIYIKHPSGHTSVYAHLRNFSPVIMDYMRKEMYLQKKNELELFLEPNILKVKKGEIIGNGGNTGSSGGSHLHFEIRDSLDRAIDPMIFNFKEVMDNTPPVLFKVAIRPLDLLSRVNGRFLRQEFTPIKEGAKYVLPQTIKITGKVGIEVYAIDRMNEVNNIFGIPFYELTQDNQPFFNIAIDHINFDISRFILSHTTLNKFTKLYQAPNNPLPYYSGDGNGVISLAEGVKKTYQLKMKDNFGNTSYFSFQMEGIEASTQEEQKLAGNPQHQVTYEREIMMITTSISEQGNLAKFYTQNKAYEIAPSYSGASTRTYLWDMNFGIPDSVDVCTAVIKPSVVGFIPFHKDHYFENHEIIIQSEPNSLLDDLFLRLEIKDYTNLKYFTINSPTEYLRNNIQVTIKNAASKADKTYLHVYNVSNAGKKSFVGGEWKGNDIQFKTRNFGTFVIDEDKTDPEIVPIKVDSSQLRFKILDKMSGIKDFEAKVNGEWILMRYEHKQNMIWSEKLSNQPFKGKVTLKVQDNAGNVKIWTTTI